MSENEKNLNNERHPLLNQLILEKVFKFLPPSDFPSTRLVCKTWLDLSLELWRSTVPLKLSFIIKKWEEQSILINNKLSIEDFLKILKNLSKITSKPYQNLHLVGRYSPEEAKEPAENIDFNYCKILKEFWKILGPNLISLTFENFIFPQKSQLFQMIHEYCPLLQKLILNAPEYLDFSNDPLNIPDLAKIPQQFNLKELQIFPKNILSDETLYFVHWLEIFTNFPKISKLLYKVNLITSHSGGNLNLLLNIFSHLKNNYPERFPLSGLILDVGMTYPINKNYVSQGMQLKLMDFGVKLVKVKVNFIKERETEGRSIILEELDENYLKKILEFHGPTLETFLTKFYDDKPDFQERRWNFPFQVEMKKLTVLELESDRFCKSFEFLKFMPNLKKLHINNCNGNTEMEKTDLISNVMVEEEKMLEDFILEKLVDFKLEYKVGGNEEMRILTKWFPNMMQVEIPLNDEQFAIICEKWQGLRKIIVRGDEITDKAICGIIGNGSSLIGGDDFDMTIAWIGCDANWNFGNLRKLEYFEAKEGRMLTPKSFQYGFRYMTGPKTIYLGENKVKFPHFGEDFPNIIGP